MSTPNFVFGALTHEGWHRAMEEEMLALEHNGTWDLVDLFGDKKVVGCKWFFTIKVNPNRFVASLKA